MWLDSDWLSNLVFLGGGLLLFLILAIAVLIWYEPRLIFYPHYPSRTLGPIAPGTGGEYEEVQLRTSDGVGIHGWFVTGGAASSPDSIPTLLFLHGNAGNISHRLNKCSVFLDLGCDVLLIDYRGYGQSEGRPEEKGTYRDADAAYHYLIQQRNSKPEDIIIYGESLGTGVAVDLASPVPVGGVILEAAFTSIPEVANRLIRGLPLGYLVRNRYDSLRKIGLLKAPLLLLHSHDDELFPLDYAQRLLEAASGHKQLVELRGSHNDAFFDSLPKVTSALRQFFESCSGAKWH